MNVNIPFYIWMLPAAMIVVAVLAFLIGTMPWRRIIRDIPTPPDDSGEEGEKAPRLTVVVYTEDTDDEIVDCVEQLVRQECDAFEVVVVCHANMESRNMLAGRLAAYENVYVTFIPPGSHNLSERKLAITLGLKAAKGDVVLTTTTNIRIPSPHWLEEMRAPFADPQVEFVLGYSIQDFTEMKGFGRWYRQFDTLLYSAAWIGSALGRRPYRGDGYNLAFRRESFFWRRGYASTVYLHYGDDDLFVKEEATAENTRVVINDDTIITSCWDGMADKMWRLRKERYNFTSRWLPKGPFLRIGFLSTCQWVMLLLLAASLALSIISLASPGAAGISLPTVGAIVLMAASSAFWLAFQGLQIWRYRAMAARLHAVRLWFAVPLFLLFHPLFNAVFRMRHHSTRQRFFTWRR